MERQLILDSLAELDDNPDVTLHFVENNTISKFYLVEGENFNINDSNGVWLDKDFADARNLSVGDNITFNCEGIKIEKEIRGLGYSPEYVFNMPYYLVKQNFSLYGFAYMSHKAFPSDTVPYNVLNVKFDGNAETFEKLLDYRLGGYYNTFVQKSEHRSVSEFENEISQHKMTADIFPLVFILVSMMILLSTIKRMISHQRTQIGILKANGFKDNTLIKHYLSYGVLTVSVASVLGLILGPVILPKISYPVVYDTFRLPYLNPEGFMNFIR
ncbi:ABC transporter permease [Methanobrevibacter millerae]|uniref:FtsX-like permease family protein n=1 Tax=Methanobrevibacter millerae TaxID=230361 RepID=A0A1G5WXW2_9EURY|nr:ABC transporter permease [Methanobrevibacter millerae]SDA62971.1 FtsX-like permease family protein [Methanobrevibacter millerae]